MNLRINRSKLIRIEYNETSSFKRINKEPEENKRSGVRAKAGISFVISKKFKKNIRNWEQFNKRI